MEQQILLEKKLRSQLIAGLITESQYDQLLEEGFFDNLKKGFADVKSTLVKAARGLKTTVADRVNNLILNRIKNRVDSKDLEKLRVFMVDTFGTTTPEISKNNIILLLKKLNQGHSFINKIQKEAAEQNSEGSFLTDLLHSLKSLTGINLLPLNSYLIGIMQRLKVTSDKEPAEGSTLYYTTGMILLTLLSKMLNLLK